MAKVSRREVLSSGLYLGGASLSRGLLGTAGLGLGLRSAAASSDTPGFRSAVDLAGMIRRKEISSVELTQYFIDRIERFDGALNAVVVRDFDRALEAAQRADQALAGGKVMGPLHGLPMTIKESFDIEGLPSTWGIPFFSDNIARKDSDVVQRFKAAGAHFMGKTNVPLALGDFQSYNEIYGTTRNPWNPERTPGGSSGGTAATLAAGMTALDSGSDIGGSIRNPAHYCGVYGHKPTWQVVSPAGHALPGTVAPPDLAVVGPMARSAEDLALAMDLVAGPGQLDAPGWQLRLPPPRKKALADYRVAVWATHDLAPPSSAIAKRIAGVADVIAQSGATVTTTARPAFDATESHATYTTLLGAFLGSRQTDEQYQATRDFVASLNDDDRSFDAVWARTNVLNHRDWVEAHNARYRIRAHWKAFFQDWDILICPIMVSTAFAHDQSPAEGRTLIVDGKEVGYWDQLFWAGLATLPFLPSTVFPTGPGDDGLPIGLQAIGAEYDDRTTIDFARLLARELGGFRAPGGFGD